MAVKAKEHLRADSLLKSLSLKRTLGVNHWAEEASNLPKASRLKLGCDVDKTFQFKKEFLFLSLQGDGGGEDLPQG